MLQLRDVIMVFKILNGLAASYLEPVLVKRFNIQSQNSRQKNHLDTTFRRTSTAQRSFFCYAIVSWNKLKKDTKNSMNIDLFKCPQVTLGIQGCALAEPGGPWRLTFALGRVENLSFFIQIICWAP